MKPSALPHAGRTLALACALASLLTHPLSATRSRDREDMEPLMARLDTIVNRAIREGASPGAALAIGHADGPPHIRTYGRIDWSRRSSAVTEGTLYDLASLTKVVATTPAVMLLVQEGRLDIDRTVASYLSWWPRDGAKGRITVRQLLLHTSGLPAGDDLWRLDGDRETRIRAIADEPLIGTPGQVTEYSDLGMILLGAVVESVTHERLDRFVEGHLFRPLAMADTRYLPLGAENGPPVPRYRIAATEQTGERGHLQGDVDDPNAWALDGVAGHAGLFSSIRDMASFARMVLAATEGEHTHVLDAAVIRSFAADRPDGGRALGWDGAAVSSWGDYFSPVSFGHNGYTGTSIWIDPERDLYVVLLTNRVDPTARNEKHLALRRAISAAVRDASPILMTPVDAAPGEASFFAAEVAAARTIVSVPMERLGRPAARQQSGGVRHATRRSTHRSRGRRAAARHTSRARPVHRRGSHSSRRRKRSLHRAGRLSSSQRSR